MKWFLGTYTSRFNRRHRLFGHLFSGRYKSLIVDGSGNGYLRTVCDYVHLNPVRARLLTGEQPLRAYAWSSYGQYLQTSGKRPAWLRVDRLLGEMGIPQDSAAGQWKALKRGWYLGDEEFRQELLAKMEPKLGRHHGGPERQETAAARAERLLAEELKRRDRVHSISPGGQNSRVRRLRPFIRPPGCGMNTHAHDIQDDTSFIPHLWLASHPVCPRARCVELRLLSANLGVAHDLRLCGGD